MKNLFNSLFRCSPRACTERLRLRLEQLESRDMPSGVAPDPIMAVAHAEFAQDGRLTRTDVIDLIDTAAGVVKAEFTNGKVSFQPIPRPNPSNPLPALWVTDLEGIVQKSAQWGLTPDVANLAGDVVNYNQANHKYHGNELLATGQLAAGDRAGILADLVQKWFLGQDLPAVKWGASYKSAAGTLFGPNGPQTADVAEGDGADCYLLSNLGEAAVQSPQTIESMFIDNGDGTYTVRFYEYNAATKTSTPQYITVDKQLPVNSKGEFVYANELFGGKQTDINDSRNVLWVALAEKAYAQLAEEGWSRASWSSKDAVNAYASIAIGDNRVAGQQITGDGHTKWFTIAADTSAQVTATMNTLAKDIQNHELLTVCTDDRTMTDPHLDQNHVYFVTAIDTQNDTITLINPYWTRGPRTVTISLTDLAKNAVSFSVISNQ